MAALGDDLHSLIRPLLYHPQTSTGFWPGVGFAVVLFIAYFLAQLIMSMVAGAVLFGSLTDEQNMVKALIIATLPAALSILGVGWLLARAGGGDPRQVLALRWPQFTPLGWLVVVGCFLVGMYAVITFVMMVFDIDPAQYTPGPNGSSPESGSAGMVKEAMFALAGNRLHFWLAFLSVSAGAPLAEELIFRGQLFATLARSWLGQSGAILVTTTLWALMHMSEPWLSVGLIFIMGLVLGALLVRFGSLYLTMICHGTWNAVYSLIILGSQAS